jgi:propanol-preferring alcohol dehydrogenase
MTQSMRAMVLNAPARPLQLESRPIPQPQDGEVLIHVQACAVCRTDLHVVDGDLKEPRLPIVPGHEIIGTVSQCSADVSTLKAGDLVGVPWLGWTCGQCTYCQRGQENLCEKAQFTGYTRDGGFADYTVSDARYVFPIASGSDPLKAAPLMCAGLIGYRAYRMTGEAQTIGLYGFGAAAHILAQIALGQGKTVYAFTKPGDAAGQDFARSLGCQWVGDSEDQPPSVMDAAILFAPVGALVPSALSHVDKGGVVVCAGIHMSDIPSFSYDLLWSEREVKSVANLTQQDGEDFLALIQDHPVETCIHTYALEDANTALDDLRAGRFEGAAVLVMQD